MRERRRSMFHGQGTEKEKRRRMRVSSRLGMMHPIVYLLVIFSLVAAGESRWCTSCTGQVSTDFLKKVVEPALLNLFYNSPDVPLEKTLGGAVRMGFHDVGAFDAARGTGRANGCFLMDDPGNDGLSPVALAISDLFARIPKRSGFSRADLFQYASMLAVKQSYDITLTQLSTPVPPLPTLMEKFRYGRVDAPDCPANGFATEAGNTTVEVERDLLPTPLGHFAHIRSVFVDRMQMTIEDMVALSGAHTLGSSTLTGSGFDGKWVKSNRLLDNSYYVNILELPWRREMTEKNKPQWGTPGDKDLMMLNTDLGLAFTVSPNDSGCNATLESFLPGDIMCADNSNPDGAEARRLVELFAGGATRNVTAGLEAWYASFIPALIRMSELGYGENELFEPCNLPPSCFGNGGGDDDDDGDGGSGGDEGGDGSSSKNRIELTLLFDDEYRASFHGTQEFRSLVEEKIALAFDLMERDVRVEQVWAGSVICRVVLDLATSTNAMAIRTLQSDAVVLQLLATTFESEVQTGLIGPLRIVRVSGLESLLGTSSPTVDPALIGPFRSAKVNASVVMTAISIVALFVVLVPALCLAFSEKEVQEVEEEEQKARTERVFNRLKFQNFRRFSTRALELALLPPEELERDLNQRERGKSRHRQKHKR